VRSSAAIPAGVLRASTASRKLFRLRSSQSSARTVPGVTVSTTARRTSLGELGILHLLADRHAVSEADQPPQVLGRRLDGNAGEGHLCGATVVARCEGEAQLPGGELRVISNIS